MESIINIHVEVLENGEYLATSKDIQGLVAQGETVQETIKLQNTGFRAGIAQNPF